jgi:nitrogen fixation/metabolism regulation signal transduction histidine kinase
MAFFLRRKQFMVDRGLQLRFARLALFFILSCCALTAAIVFYTTFTSLSEKLVGIYPQTRLDGIFHSAYVSVSLGLLLVAPVIFYGAIVFSHRVAGPLPKIYQALRDIGGGHFDVKVTLRKKDELKELADEINAMAAKLKEREGKP